jgi:uncharacterized protein with von Willebrand factor type A (vWA) domain
MAGLETVAVTMARTLRGLGVAAPPDATLAYAAALAEVGVDRRSSAYWAGRATLVRRPEDVPAYDRAFTAVFEGRTWDGDEVPPAEPVHVTLLVDTDDEPPPGDAGGEPEPIDGPTFTLRWTDRELLRTKDFARCTVDELDEAHRLMGDLRLVGARRRSRRQRPTHRRRGPIDVGATTRRALHTGGEPLRTVHRQAGDRPRRVVLLCDVSGSMEAYARALVRFAHVAVVGRAQVEVFTLGTRCTRITRELGSRDPDAALDAVAGAVEDWSGGTRLGEGLRTFNEQWGLRGLARGAVVVILSDGWDRGDPAVLAEQVRRLQRVAHRLVWVNPLKASPGFAPIAQGMAAALPYVDELVEGHSLASLEALAEVIAR